MSDDIVARAYKAYYRAVKRNGWIHVAPGNCSGTMMHDGTEFVVLRNMNDVLAVYRVTASGGLRWVDEGNWPAGVDE